jgi:hypothetical protein
MGGEMPQLVADGTGTLSPIRAVPLRTRGPFVACPVRARAGRGRPRATVAQPAFDRLAVESVHLAVDDNVSVNAFEGDHDGACVDWSRTAACRRLTPPRPPVARLVRGGRGNLLR